MDERYEPAILAPPKGRTPRPFTDRALAREANRRGNEARRATRAALKALRDLPALVDVSSAKEVLAKLAAMGVANTISGSRLLATVRAVEIFLRQVNDEQARAELAEVKQMLRELKAERARLGRAG
jgi:hypothetical protein